MKQITPVIKRTRVRTEKFEVCPHCRKEIMEKESYVDHENYVYHRSCQDKGPIAHFEPMSAEEFRNTFSHLNEGTRQAAGVAPMQKTAGGYPVKDVSGSIKKNIAGTDYQFNWAGAIGLVQGDRSQDNVRVDKPSDMPDYMWFQTKDAIEEEALKAAVKQTIDYLKIQKSIAKKSWLDRAILGKMAQFADVDGPEEDFEGYGDDGHHVTAAKKGVKKPVKSEGQPIDETLLADGLGAFLDVFVNYHSGKEGDKLAKWVIAICNDPKYAEVARKLEQFHGLMGTIYKDVIEIANQDESARGKVAAVLAKIKTAASKE